MDIISEARKISEKSYNDVSERNRDCFDLADTLISQTVPKEICDALASAYRSMISEAEGIPNYRYSERINKFIRDCYDHSEIAVSVKGRVEDGANFDFRSYLGTELYFLVYHISNLKQIKKEPPPRRPFKSRIPPI